MPELPEVESIRRSVEVHILGRRIARVDVLWHPVCEGWQDYDFAETLAGREFIGTDRRGKYLILHMSGGWSIIAHMRMTGRLIYHKESCAPEKHTHLVFHLDHGQLHFNDQRKFGRFVLMPSDRCQEYPSLKQLGPEPLAPDFTARVLGERLAGKRKNLKAALLDQSVLAGLGNIYTDEALFRAGISPERTTDSLTAVEVEKLFRAIQEVLIAGIEAQGTSFRDYRNANGEKGSFQEDLRVYGRGLQPCLHCGGILAKKKVAGRTTVFCPHCQH